MTKTAYNWIGEPVTNWSLVCQNVVIFKGKESILGDLIHFYKICHRFWTPYHNSPFTSICSNYIMCIIRDSHKQQQMDTLINVISNPYLYIQPRLLLANPHLDGILKKEEQENLTCQDPINRGVSGQTRLSTFMKNPSIRQVLWQQETPRMENKSVRNTARPLRTWTNKSAKLSCPCWIHRPYLGTKRPRDGADMRAFRGARCLDLSPLSL